MQALLLLRGPRLCSSRVNRATTRPRWTPETKNVFQPNETKESDAFTLMSKAINLSTEILEAQLKSQSLFQGWWGVRSKCDIIKTLETTCSTDKFYWYENHKTLRKKKDVERSRKAVVFKTLKSLNFNPK